jgi:hypothetical protein
VWPDAFRPFVGELDSEGTWAAWRLTTDNHREVGRSPRVFRSLGQAEVHACLVRAGATLAELHFVTLPRTRLWVWQLGLDGIDIATSSRGFARYRECEYNAQAFIGAATAAQVCDAAQSLATTSRCDVPRGALSRS